MIIFHSFECLNKRYSNGNNVSNDDLKIKPRFKILISIEILQNKTQ